MVDDSGGGKDIVFKREREREKEEEERGRREKEERERDLWSDFFVFLIHYCICFSNEERERERWTCCLDPTSPSHRKR